MLVLVDYRLVIVTMLDKCNR